MIFKTIIPWFVYFQAACHFFEASATSGREPYNVERISHSSLINDLEDAAPNKSHDVLDALSEKGIISVTGIPGFAELKRDTLSWLHACIMDQGDTKHKLIHEDGTIRRTIASITVPGPGGAQPFKFTNQDNSEDIPASCIEFSKKLDSFRNQVDTVVKDFALRLSSEMDSSLEKPLMQTEDGSYSFSNIYSVVAEGHHLEHFHSYQKLNDEGKQSASSGLRNDQNDTIEMHTDQGFFIAFTPGLMVTHKTENNKYEPDLSVPLEASDGFYIEMTDGKQIPVHFDTRDELVFMMGDGVNQYINPKLVRNSDGTQKKGVRATPHKVVLKSHDANVARVWYGRMALPPPFAYHSAEKMTHGEIRSLVNKRGENSEGNQKLHQGIGCSSPDSMRLLSGGNDGHTSDISCQDDESIYCWFRCMSLVDQNVTKAECAAQNLNVQCINPRDQFSDGKKHGDYYPFCSNTTQNITDYPKLSTYPANVETCDDDAWNTFSTSGDFQHSFDLKTNHTTAKFRWSVLDDKKTVKATVRFRGLFGWIAMGFANLDPDAGHKGMNGGTVVLALPYGGGEYSAKTGLDLTKGQTISEYFIHEKATAFRHWSTPITSSTSTARSTDPKTTVDYANVESTECFTSITMETDHIHEKTFNVGGSNEMLWAANGEDAFAGYHGRNRARFSVDWTGGKAKFYVAPKTETIAPTAAPSAPSSSSQAIETKTWMAIAFGALLHFTLL